MAWRAGRVAIDIKCEASTKARRAVAPHLPRTGILLSYQPTPSSEFEPRFCSSQPSVRLAYKVTADVATRDGRQAPMHS